MSRRRLSAILIIDVVGYSRMMQNDPGSVLASLNTVYRTVVAPNVDVEGGRIVKLLGDGALIEFPGALQALNCAVSIQRELRKPDAPYHTPEPIFLRAGLHAGDVMVDGGDIFGDGVNIAARLQGAAKPGGILASKIFCDLAGSDISVSLKREGAHTFKGISQPIEVLSVDLVDPKVRKHRAALAEAQQIRFCETKDHVRLAWTSNGNGRPVAKAPNWISHLELDWQHPGFATLSASIAAKWRFIRFDARGNGLSDWDISDLSFEHFVDDLECVFDAAEIKRAPILAMSQGCAIAAAFAMRQPERVSGIVMIGGYAEGRAFRRSKKDREMAKAMKEMMTVGWDDDYPSMRDLLAQMLAPAVSEEERRSYAERMRSIISPENLGRFREVIEHVDLSKTLSKVEPPCLVLHCRGDRMQPIEQGRKLAAGLPNARFVTYESGSHVVPESDPVWPQMERDIHAFLTTQT